MTDTESTRQEEHYAGQIKGGLRPSMRLVVMGIVHKQAKSMVVTVSCPPQGEGEEEEEGDVGLQMTVNFPEKAVRRNYRMAGKWGNCESALSFFPFASGESFKMEIVCEHQQFRVLVDGQPLCGFTHRVTQLASLTSLRVVGDLQLTKVA
ncbi:galectin-related protein A-like [Astyanax mexicanus]|uniref:Galectin n=2 Tax=Astyanax mexicanus TaxID=7994 RepID=A0A8B9H9U6_ASTMX|nr:galectin-related protein A-like [Astyanax mexicanus]